MWTRTAMVVSVLVLAALVFATPYLLGRPTPELSSVPQLIVSMSQDNESWLIVYGTAAVQAYLYESIRLSFNESAPSVNGASLENHTYGLVRWVPANASFTVDATFVDKAGNYFQYNVTVHLERDSSDRLVIVVTFPYEKDNLNTVIRRYPPDEFRQAIPWRGVLA